MKKQLLPAFIAVCMLSLSLFSCKKEDTAPKEDKPEYDMVGRWIFHSGGYYNPTTLELEDEESFENWIDIIFHEDGTTSHATNCCDNVNWKDSSYPNKVNLYGWYFDVKYQRDGFTFLLADTAISTDAIYDGLVYGYVLQNYDSVPR